jgi:nitroimidazol reductase NimA-like FMN-containing flavoprotein (pyridoxamine 5'-phosphate oxidase superfamily)
MPAAMTKAQREEFLAALHVGVVSVTDAGRGPLTVPIWYLYEPGGDIVIITPPDSRKGRLMNVGTRVSFVAQSEELPPKYVSVEGPIVSIDAADVDRDVRALTTRYLGKEIGDAYVDATRPDGTTAEVVIRIRPERWFSRDFAQPVPGEVD